MFLGANIHLYYRSGSSLICFFLETKEKRIKLNENNEKIVIPNVIHLELIDMTMFFMHINSYWWLF